MTTVDFTAAEYVAELIRRDYTNLGLTPTDGQVEKLAHRIIDTMRTDPDGLAHLRKSWAAMSDCLIRLAKFEEPSPDMLADVPLSHRAYLLGHAALHRQTAEMYRRHQGAKKVVSDLMRGKSHEEKAALYRVLEVLRGEDPDAS